MSSYITSYEEDHDAADKICRRTQNEADFLSTIELQLKTSPPPNENHLTRFVTYTEFMGYTSALPVLLNNPATLIDGLTTAPIGDAQISTDKAISMYQSLLQAGWNINSRMKYQGDALYQAIGKDNQTLVKWLLDNGADPRINDDFMEYTQVEHAVLAASPAVVALLIEQGGMSPNDCRALEYASREGKIETVQVLLDLGMEVDLIVDPRTKVYISPEEEKIGFGSALHRAAQKGHDDVVRLLLERGANPHMTDTKGLTALDWARKMWRMKVLLILSRAMKVS